MNRNAKISLVPATGRTFNNFHTHTWRCRHADGDVDAYADRAEALHMNKLGMSDHAYSPGDTPANYHMMFEDAPGYVEACRNEDRKRPDLTVFCALECDYDPRFETFYREEYLGKLGMDYLTGSIHESKDHPAEMNLFNGGTFGLKQLREYTDLYIKGIESGLFLWMNHPDLYGLAVDNCTPRTGWTKDCDSAAEEICTAAVEHDVALEVNTSGLLKMRTKGADVVFYPRGRFWEIAASLGVKAILNTDAHKPEHLDLDIDYGFRIIEEYGLTRVEPERV